MGEVEELERRLQDWVLVNVFVWRVKVDRIPTRSALNERGIDLDTVLCPRCGDCVEDLDHDLVGCRKVKKFWERLVKWWGKDVGYAVTPSDLIQEHEEILKATKGISWWVEEKWYFVYLVWTHRNKAAFGNEKGRVQDLFIKWQMVVFEWLIEGAKRWQLIGSSG
ncbi:hypothetical protein OSB04_un001331 [Centaurea solstitialis]|uniref:Reverse transcriptase zinc-binding domain-containing protein n=1 Tax=Centaurea solstitialis TaxID=347529 RepID=A0AA38S2C7_9ASTR|nr:hypothetical protein OSB04_un001331 [Centaurea solstitialis]